MAAKKLSSFLKLLTSQTLKIGRWHYFLRALIILLLTVILNVTIELYGIFGIIGPLEGLALSLLLIYISIIAIIQRLNDLGLGKKYFLVPFLITYTYILIMGLGLFHHNDALKALLSISIFFNVGMQCYLIFKKGNA